MNFVKGILEKNRTITRWVNGSKDVVKRECKIHSC